MPIEQILNLDKDETVIKEIKRHPIGLYGLYLFAVTSILVWLGMLYWSLNAGSDTIVDLPRMGYIVLFSFLITISLLFTLIGVHVYKSNELVITNENIIQVLQFGLLNRQISQLNLAKIQDVSVDQAGILSTIFGYGTLDIETAGEASNFRFKYSPTPNEVAKIIIEAHEDYIAKTHRPSSDGT